MSVTKHHAIIVTGQIGVGPKNKIDWIDMAWHEARVIFGITDRSLRVLGRFGIVSDLMVSPLNGVKSFLIAPDGSYEGYDESDTYDAKRDAFVDWVRAQIPDWGYPPVLYVEVSFEDEMAMDRGEDAVAIVRHSRQDPRPADEDDEPEPEPPKTRAQRIREALPTSTCELGFTRGDLYSALGEVLYPVFRSWAVENVGARPVCQSGDCGGQGGHGPVFYSHDVVRFLETR